LFEALLKMPETDMRAGIVATIARDVGVEPPDVERALAEQLGLGPTAAARAMEGGQTALLAEEYDAFIAAEEEHRPEETFITSGADLAGLQSDPSVSPLLADTVAPVEQLVLATRLREVRALTGFRRLDGTRRVRPDLGKRLDWLPAIEVFGEGIFFRLRESKVAEWQSRPAVARRAAILARRLGDSYLADDLPTPDARLVLLHTLAHLLMRQLTFEAGYSSSSLRERIYSSSPDSDGPTMAGILIYTAAGDSEGTMGGLVRQGEPRYFAATVAETLQQAAWCSLDPICRESEGQGPDSLSLSACHACSLVSETSCVYANCLLDRCLVVDPEVGFFGRQVATLLESDEVDG
jgi:hypothetical protein